MQVSTGEAAKATEAGAIGVKMALIRNSTNPVTIIRYIMQIPQVGTKPHWVYCTEWNALNIQTEVHVLHPTHNVHI